jgi:hypothetical protein
MVSVRAGCRSPIGHQSQRGRLDPAGSPLHRLCLHGVAVAKRAEAFHEAVRAHMRTQAKPNAATATQEVYAQRGHEFAHTDGYCGLAGTPQ